MTNEEINNILISNPDSYTQIFKSRHFEFYTKIQTEFTGEKFGEKLFKFLHRNEPNVGICKNCKQNICKFVSMASGYRSYCSKLCSNQATVDFRAAAMIEKNKENRGEYYEKKLCLHCNTEFESLKYRNQRYCNAECSGAQLTKNHPARVEKIKHTKVKNHKDPNFVNIKQAKATNLERYGAENVFSSPEIKEKIYNTNLEKYGNKIAANSDGIKPHAVKKFLIYSYNLNKDRYDDKFEFLFDQENYKGVDHVYRFKCKQCHAEFEDDLATTGHPRCQVCNPLHPPVSKGEAELYEYVKSILPVETQIIKNDRTVLDGKELDLYVPSKNIAIEFNGLYWHSELRGKKSKNYHLDKTRMCLEKNIHLIHILEDEWVEKREIVCAKLLHLLGENKKTPAIYARKCEIKIIENCAQFLKATHIQGTSPAPIKIGAFYQEKLVAVMTLGKLRLALGNRDAANAIANKDTYELLRFSTTGRITGIASKLLAFFVKTYCPKKIITFADRRYSWRNSAKLLVFQTGRIEAVAPF